MQQLVDERVLTRSDRGEFELASAIQAYIAHREKRSGTGSTYSTDRARWMAAKAKRAEIEAAELAGELVRKKLVVRDWSSIASTLCTHLLGLPARAVPRLILCQNEAAMASVLAEFIDEHLDEIRHARFIYTDDEGPEPKRRRRKTNGATTKILGSDPKLDRAIDRCAADMARGVRGTVGQGLPESFWTALKLMDAVRRDADGHEAVERLKLDWLVEQTLARLVARIEAGLKRRCAGGCCSGRG